MRLKSRVKHTATAKLAKRKSKYWLRKYSGRWLNIVLLAWDSYRFTYALSLMQEMNTLS